MKAVFAFLVLFGVSAYAEDPITQNTIIKFLEANHGQSVGHSELYNESCEAVVFKPGQMDDSQDYYLEYTFEKSPAYHVADFPSGKFVDRWVLDSINGVITIYHDAKDPADKAEFFYDLTTYKLKSFRLPRISCENMQPSK